MKYLLDTLVKKLDKWRPNFYKIEQLKLENEQLRTELERYKTWMPPGHFYSPIPSLEELKIKEKEIFDRSSKEIPGINFYEEEQINLFSKFKDYYKELPFEAQKQKNLRYFFENQNYSYSDAIFLFCMIRYAKPKKIIEIGSGYSSCVILDTNEIFFENSISCTFIEPYPQLLHSLIKKEDKEKIEIIPKNLQDVELENFSGLSANDILIIDSTHVSKTNSDVNYIFFEILPYINSGVHIHIHDIFHPFEYPEEWIYEGRAWNEIYLLRAFLQYNNLFKIEFFNSFLSQFYEDMLLQEMPLCMKNPGGSIWLRKV